MLDNELEIYSWFSLAMFIWPISFGHSAEQAPVFVHEPKPSSSIVATMLVTLFFLSTFPWGSIERCETLAEVKSIAEEFLQAATHAPHPIQADDRKASSASSFFTGNVFASHAPPVSTDM